MSRDGRRPVSIREKEVVKELRLAGISDLEGANRFLKEDLLPKLNRRFVVEAADPVDLHAPRRRVLKELWSWEDERVVRRDLLLGNQVILGSL